MQFKDAAYEILKQVGKPLHYNLITDKALAAGILETSGKILPAVGARSVAWQVMLEANQASYCPKFLPMIYSISLMK